MTDRHVRLEGGYYVRRPQAEPENESRLLLGLVVVAEVLGALAVFLSLFLGIPFLLWLVAS